MSEKSKLGELLRDMHPELHPGEFVFSTVELDKKLPQKFVIGEFKEKEGKTVIIERSKADQFGLPYTYISSWITLTVDSPLDAVGLTAAFSAALAAQGISCNVVAAYHHDHIFVSNKDGEKALKILKGLSAQHQ